MIEGALFDEIGNVVHRQKTARGDLDNIKLASLEPAEISDLQSSGRWHLSSDTEKRFNLIFTKSGQDLRYFTGRVYSIS